MTCTTSVELKSVKGSFNAQNMNHCTGCKLQALPTRYGEGISCS